MTTLPARRTNRTHQEQIDLQIQAQRRRRVPSHPLAASCAQLPSPPRPLNPLPPLLQPQMGASICGRRPFEANRLSVSRAPLLLDPTLIVLQIQVFDRDKTRKGKTEDEKLGKVTRPRQPPRSLLYFVVIIATWNCNRTVTASTFAGKVRPR